jgi:PRTRC genetic system protein C
MESRPLVRHFEFNGLRLPDIDPKLPPEEIRALYSHTYPDIATASIAGPEVVGDKLVYRFTRAIEIQGAFAFFFRLGFQALCL